MPGDLGPQPNSGRGAVSQTPDRITLSLTQPSSLSTGYHNLSRVTMRDIDQAIRLVRDRNAGVTVAQYRASHPADDDGLWFFSQPNSPFEVQVESSTGMCPFLIETDENEERVTAETIAEAVEAVIALLHLK